MCTNRNMYGREYQQGIGLSTDFRSLLIQDLIDRGCDSASGKVPWGALSATAKKFKVSVKTVNKIWRRFVEHGTCTEKMRNKSGPRKLTEPDQKLIECLKRETPSMSCKEIQEKLRRYSPVSGEVSLPTINRCILKNLKFTYKRLKYSRIERFTNDNMIYSQAYIDFCQTKNTQQIKFMDESGFKLTNANRTYGHSRRGEPCVEIGRFVKDRNLTLNLLIGKDCVLYYNFVDGSSNIYTYLNFWEEAAQNQDEYGRAVLISGDFVVVDNCPIHRNNSERVLRHYFGMHGVQYGFLPVYSPDFNPVENCFLKLKKILSQEKYLPYLQVSLKFAITQALKEISSNDIRQFYRQTGYLNV